MIKLSERLKAIADQVLEGCTAADIGTDHAQIPIYLLQTNRVPGMILSDNKEGPLRKAMENLTASGVTLNPEDLRKGDGLRVLKRGEVSTVIIAGMGGLLIAAILSDDLEKSLSFQRLILQPRTASADLRRWLIENGFHIVREQLAQEGRRFCEIITAEPGNERMRQDNTWDALDYEISPLLFENKDPGLKAFLENKLREAKDIRLNLERSRDPNAAFRIKEAEERIKKLTERNARL